MTTDSKTLRDEIAIAAMAAIIAVPHEANAYGYVVAQQGGDPTRFIAGLSYALADAMLAAREQES